MLELNTQSFPEFVRLADYLWLQGYESIPQSMRNSGFVKEVSIPESSGTTREFTEADSNQYIQPMGEGDQAVRGKAVVGHKKIMTVTRFAENFGISYQMRSWGKNPEIISGLTALGQKPALTMDLDLSHRLTFGASTFYIDRSGATITTTCGDGLALFSTAHTLTGSSTTYRNILANNPQLSPGSLRAMEKMGVENCYNNFGEKVAANYSILWVTDDPVQVAIAEELTKSTASVDGANSGVYNVNKGRYQVIILPRVATTAAGAPDTTKVKYWGLVDPSKSTFMLGIWEQPKFIPASSATEDLDTDEWTFRTRASYGIVTVSGRGFLFSKGDAKA